MKASEQNNDGASTTAAGATETMSTRGRPNRSGTGLDRSRRGALDVDRRAGRGGYAPARARAPGITQAARPSRTAGAQRSTGIVPARPTTGGQCTAGFYLV
ncbi:hypothetical protein EVAR_87782_1 [Eumeta japonica]|uniref:Uncharacterized protein n=1 Tax=Eumeta variegata TaxID=151549 RepID=A0A4C1X778_EUMVA|nr:hypothetical protein EVAR_87782_1 [Eumeta japonica]